MSIPLHRQEHPAALPPGKLAIFSRDGFRPFFLFAGAYGVIPIVAWLGALVGVLNLPGDLTPVLWHGHEMVFGFGIAAVSGFLLTAVPNWTGTGPVRGGGLILLAALWLAGRVAMWFGWPLGAPFVAVADLSLIPALMILVGSRIVAKGMRRNYIFLGLLAGFFTANVLMHLEMLGLSDATGMIGLRLGVFLFALLIALLGGRVVPNFTANALRAEGHGEEIGTPPTIEKLTLASLLAAIVANLVLGGPVAGVLSLAAAAMLALRMRRWGTFRILHEPIVWVLHLGHAWLAVGFALTGLAHLTQAISHGAALHALTAGAMGTMILGIATRAALGHSGRPIKAAPPIAAAYIMVSLGALVRIMAPWFDGLLGGGLYGPLIAFGATLWGMAFLVFTIVYWPILSGPRADGRG